MHKFLAGLLLILALTACGYRLGISKELSAYRTISVPYVEGDVDGALTTFIIEELVASGPLSFESSEYGDLTLLVSVQGERSESIGFQFPRQVGAGDDRLVPSEQRLRYLIQGRLIDTKTGEEVVEPFYLTEGVDFDFLPIGSVAENVLEFSLGQLDSQEGARVYASRDIFRKLAKSIALYTYSIY